MLDFSPSKLFTIANFISALRIILVPFIGWFLFLDTTAGMLWAGGLLVLAILTDLLDGLAARLLGQVSDLGKIIDPLADKLFVIFTVALFVFLREFPLWIALLIVGKDLLIVIASALVIGRRKVVMASNLIGKYAFAFQAGLVLSHFLRFPFGIAMFTIGTLVFIALSLLSYGWAMLKVLGSPDGEVVIGSGQRPAWMDASRRAGVAFLALLWFVNLWFWMFEDASSVAGRDFAQRVQIGNAEELLQRYAPVLDCSPEGRRPVDPRQIFSMATVRPGPRYLFGLLTDVIPVTGDDGSHAEGESWLDYDPQFAGETLVYACAWAVTEADGAGSTVLMYWLFFTEESAPVMRRGDWELVLITLDGQGAPRWLTTTHGWAAVTTPWEQVSFADGRVIIHLGVRSNTPSVTAGTVPLYLEPERIISAGADDAPGGDRLFPEAGYRLIRMGGYGDSWSEWSGYWGGPQPGGDRGPCFWTPKRAALSPWDHPLAFVRSGLPPMEISAR